MTGHDGGLVLKPPALSASCFWSCSDCSLTWWFPEPIVDVVGISFRLARAASINLRCSSSGNKALPDDSGSRKSALVAAGDWTTTQLYLGVPGNTSGKEWFDDKTKDRQTRASAARNTEHCSRYLTV